MGVQILPASVAGSVVKSVQRGEATLVGAANSAVNITISAVTMSKTFININGGTSTENVVTAYLITLAVGAVLTTSTNLQIKRGASATSGSVISWEVIEYV